MQSLRSRWRALAALTALVACHDAPTRPDGALDVGQSLVVQGAQELVLKAGPEGGDYVAVLVNPSTTAGGSESYALSGTGLDGALMQRSPAASLLHAPPDEPSGPTRDVASESRRRDLERADLEPRMAAARSWAASRRAAIPAAVRVGDTVTVNVNGTQSCTNPIYHRARVAAIGTHSIVMSDVGNPPGGFTDADYRRYAARFDTLVYPLDVAAFGEPTDLDGNGRVGLIFTLEVNRLTPSNSATFIGGLTFSRDLFPITGTARAQGCATSNEGEYFYLLAPDPLGRVNGNRRTTGFVDSSTTAVIAHELQHLINSSRRLYMSETAKFEEKWLDEGLSHVAEELLFYRESGLAPRSNLSAADLRAPARAAAFSLDMVGGGNVARYRSYLLNPARSSPYASNDSLPTRGAAWSLLRYLADRAAPADGDLFYRLANGPATGMANLQAVFGADVQTRIRDWSVSHAVDDAATTESALQQPSWNWHSIYDSLYSAYPLQLRPMTDASTQSGSVVAGGAVYYRFSIPPDSSATVTLRGQSGQSGSRMQLVIVRTR